MFIELTSRLGERERYNFTFKTLEATFAKETLYCISKVRNYSNEAPVALTVM